MKLLERFKSYLVFKKNKTSKVTIKNYLSDIRKFIKWYEKQSSATFNPKKTTPETINLYKLYLNTNQTPPNSVERYLSSLRKFFKFLKEESLVNSNPLEQGMDPKQLCKDPLMLDAFKIYLLSNNISKLTVKNYLMDIKQFFTWLEKVIKPAENALILNNLNELTIDEYKDRLLYQAHLSPVSVNRKLSSLRKYNKWVGKNNINVKKVSIEKTPKTTGHNTIDKLELFRKIEAQNNQKIHENKNNNTPPSKKLKKTINILNAISDFLITLPIVKLLEKSEFIIWKIKGSEVFTPIPSILKKSDIQYNYKNIKNIHNISKITYSPLKISINSLPKHKKIYFHLKHTRPRWYKKYHSYGLTHYFHISILIIFTSASGSLLYNSFQVNYPQQKTVFASPPWIRPKILAFQGKLSDSNNNPITSATLMRFTIYNNPSSSGSALLWQEVQTITPDADGIFKAQIGQENILSSSLLSDNPALYLGMTVGNDKELQPRQELATVSSSNNAQQLQGLIPITKNDAGTSNVILALNSAGNLTIGGKASPIFEAIGGQFTLSGRTLLLTSTEGSDGNIKIVPDGEGIIDLQKPLQNTTNNNNMESAQGAVEIDDLFAILATSSGQSALTINQNSIGPLISASTSGIAKFTLENNGTGIFAGNLFVNGDNLTSSNTSFNLLNTDTINLNIGNAATDISIGANAGNTKINNTLIANAGIITGSSISPSITGAYDLGSLTNRWKNTYIDYLYTNDLIVSGATTESAKFKIFGSGTKAGTASTSGQLTFTNNSQINLLNNANLGFYNSASGDSGINTANPSLYLASNENIGIGTNNPTAKLQVNGIIKAQKIDSTGGADLAENYISSQSLEPGDIIMPEGKNNNLAVIKTTKAYESKTLGIVSTNPAITLNSDAQADDTHPYVFPIALSGRVPVKVTTENGSIKAGDYLSASSLPGAAMKTIDKGIVIGKALEDYTNPDIHTIGKIMVFVSLSTYDPSSATGYSGEYNQADNNSSISDLIQILSEAFVDNIKVGFIQAQKTVTDSLTITTDNITIGSQTLREYITEIVRNSIRQEIEKELTNSRLPSGLLSPLASESATALKPDNSQAGSASPSALITNNAQLPPNFVATSSGKAAPDSTTYITNVTNIYNNFTATPGADLRLASDSAFSGNPSASGSALANIPTASNSALSAIASASGEALMKEDSLASDPSQANTGTQSVLNLIEKNQQLTNDYANLSSLSGLLAYTPNLKQLPASSNLGIVGSTLQVLGPSTLSDVAIVGQLNVNGSLILADNSINTFGSDFELQPLRQGKLSVMGGLLTIDTDGNLKAIGNAEFAKNVTVKEKLTAAIIAPVPDSDLIIQLDNQKSPDSKSATRNPQLVIRNSTGSAVLAVNQIGDILASGSGTFSNLVANSFNIIRGAQADTSLTQTTASSSAGTAVITTHETERTIISPFITKDSLIYLTAASDTQGLIPYIARQTEKDFTIAIPYAVNKDIKINWWIVN